MIELGLAQPSAGGSVEGSGSGMTGSSSSKGSKGAMGGSGSMGMGVPSGMGEGGSGGGVGAPGGQATGKPILDAEGKPIPASFPASRCDFIVQFAFQPRFDPEGGEKAGGLLPKPPEPEATEAEAGQDPAASSAETAG